MATTKFSVGIFFKNPLGVVGNLKEKVPFLVKTLASLVYMSDGTDVESAINDKVDQVDGKGLSTNDYTNDDMTKVREGYAKQDIDDMLNGCRFKVVDGILQIEYSD